MSPDEYSHAREAGMEARLSVLEERLTYHGREVGRLTQCVSKLDDTLSALTASMREREAADRALRQAAENVAKTGLTKREIFLTTIMVLVMLSSFIISLLTFLEH